MKLKENNYKIEGKVNIKICHISDIHFNKQYNLKIFDELYKCLKNKKIDYICITGDTLDDAKIIKEKEVKYLIKFINKLSTITKVIISIGNHDESIYTKRKVKYKDTSKFFNKLKSENVIVLNNSYYETINLIFIGYTRTFKLYKKEMLNEKEINLEVNKLIKNTNKYQILLSHSPVGMKDVNVDLILCGHNHNGLVPTSLESIFKHRGIISPSKKFFPKDIRGFYDKNNIININGGIVKLSYVSGFFRHFNRFFKSHIDFIEISNKKHK